MKVKGIIGTVIVVAIVIVGAAYFMNAQPAKASTNDANTSSDSNTLTTAKNTSSNLNNNKSAQTQNISRKTNPSQSNNLNKSNNNASNNQINTHSNNQVNNSNSSNSSNSSNNNGISKQAIAKDATPSINTGTGNFADIITGANYMIGTIDNTEIIIPLKGGHVINNLLVLPEYYVNRLNETFTAKIASLGNNNFKLYEYYNGQNTAIFDLKYHSNQYNPTLAGTFTHTGSNEVTGITFNIICPNAAPPLMQMPFYHTVINGTPVTITSVNKVSGAYYEKYEGDNNLFSLNINCYYNSYSDQNYQNQLIESYNGQETGEYLINMIPNTGNSEGVFITKPGTGQSQTFKVTLTGSLNPQ